MSRSSVSGLVAALGLVGAVEAQQPRIRTYLPQSNLVPGQTYELHVSAKTNIPGIDEESFSAVNWTAQVPNISGHGPLFDSLYTSGQFPTTDQNDIVVDPQAAFNGIGVDLGWRGVPGFENLNGETSFTPTEGFLNKDYDNGRLIVYNFTVPSDQSLVGATGEFSLGGVQFITTTGPDRPLPYVYEIPWAAVEKAQFTIVPGSPTYTPADTNCDGAVDFFDIDPFLTGLFTPSVYAGSYPDCDISTCDTNQDSTVDFFDIDPFLNSLFNQP